MGEEPRGLSVPVEQAVVGGRSLGPALGEDWVAVSVLELVPAVSLHPSSRS